MCRARCSGVRAALRSLAFRLSAALSPGASRGKAVTEEEYQARAEAIVREEVARYATLAPGADLDGAAPAGRAALGVGE